MKILSGGTIMKILRSGKMANIVGTQFECTRCNCAFEIQEAKEVRAEQNSPAYNTGLAAQCPECGAYTTKIINKGLE